MNDVSQVTSSLITLSTFSWLFTGSSGDNGTDVHSLFVSKWQCKSYASMLMCSYVFCVNFGVLRSGMLTMYVHVCVYVCMYVCMYVYTFYVP